MNLSTSGGESYGGGSGCEGGGRGGVVPEEVSCVRSQQSEQEGVWLLSLLCR